jgi:putative methionine-R-sulfoxide reductase with GAF domain
MSTPDADELLRQEVAKLVERDDCVWAGIYFVEGHELVLGPEAGTPDLERRVGVPVTWRGERIAELVADGAMEPAELEQIAASIADLCLVGWDTGGELWQS